MVLLIGIAAAVAVAVLAYWLATVRRDNEWLKGQIVREREALGSMREAFERVVYIRGRGGYRGRAFERALITTR